MLRLSKPTSKTFLIATFSLITLSSTAKAWDRCPDLDGRYEGGNFEGGDFVRGDVWFVPIKAGTGSINYRKTLANLINNYANKNQPRFSCSDDYYNNCRDNITGNYFDLSGGSSNFPNQIPDRSGTIFNIGSDLRTYTTLVSCRKKTKVYYSVSTLRKKDRGDLPYLLLRREIRQINVSRSGNSPRF